MISKFSLLALACITSTAATANKLSDSLTHGKTQLNMNLRFEGVNQDNAKKDAKALTLRTRLTYSTKPLQGWSALVEFEDSRNVLGIADYNNTIGANTGYSVIADPETTELDQALIKYQTKSLTAKFGRQVLTFDNQRFIGDVGWRQDRQTFDGVSFAYETANKITLNYAFINQRNRIFAENKDIKSQDHLINVKATTHYGNLVGYSYLLSQDNGTKNDIDSYGLRFSGKTKTKKIPLNYQVEWATQSTYMNNSNYSANYTLIELGTIINGINVRTGVERLGSDNGNYGFATPLATLHKFNGWTDQFLSTPKQGLNDLYISAGNKIFGGKISATYHRFSTIEKLNNYDDLGCEVDVIFVKPLHKKLKLGVKYGKYFAGDDVFSKVDSTKLWLWLNASF